MSMPYRWPEPRTQPFRFPTMGHSATATGYALQHGPVVDFLAVLAHRARYAPLTPQTVAARVAHEQHLKVRNWVADGLNRRAHMAIPHAWLMEPDGTWREVY